MVAIAPEIESKYDILQKMGEGGMGAVYKVRHRLLDEIQVVKLMQAKFSTDTGLRERFLREAKTAKQLRHPNIAEVIDFSITADNTAFIVMEFIEGVNLRDVLTQGGKPLNPGLVVSVGQQALKALGFLHRKKFVHRDISPDNIMLTRDSDGQPLVKLIDLGITKSTEETHSLTMAGQFVGKPHYASPEQFGGTVDGRSDLYSFGIVLYELLTGLKPIDGRDYMSVIAGHISHGPKPFTETDPQGRIPQPLRQVVLKALQKVPAERFQNAEEFAAALADVKIADADYAFTTGVSIGSSDQTVAGTAEDIIDAEDFKAASAADTVADWEKYVAAHPRSVRAAEARKRLEELEDLEETDWQAAQKAESSESIRAYLSRHAESPRAGKARRLLEKIEATEGEARAWEAASQVDAVTGWEMYLNAHTGSARAADARRRLEVARRRDEEERAWKLADVSDTVPAWREYLKHCGDSPRGAEANRRLAAAERREAEDRAWSSALLARSAAGWEAFLREYPASARSTAARAQLIEIEQREAERQSATRAATELAAKKAADEAAAKKVAAEADRKKAAEEVAKKQAADAAAKKAAAEAAARKAAGETAAKASAEAARVAQQEESRRQAAAEDAAWNAVRASGSTSALQAFIQKNPKSRYVADARGLFESLEAEQGEVTDWRTATATNDADVWKWFISRHPRSPRVDDARKQLAKAVERAAQAKRGEAASAPPVVQRRSREVSEDDTVRGMLPVLPTPTPVPTPIAPPRPADTETERPRLPKPALYAGAAAAVVAIVAAVLLMRSPAPAPTDPQPEPPRVETQQPVPEPEPVPQVTPPATVGQGQLVINASPWAEIESIRDADGAERLSARPAYTPLVVALPPGAYTVSLINPNSRQKLTRKATVAAGGVAQIKADTDVGSADAYLDRLTRAKR